MKKARRHEGTEARRGAFTIIELLIVIAVIVLLLSILTVAIAAASRTSQSANTRALMGSLRQALIGFHRDVGYYPPVLDGQRSVLQVPTPNAAGNFDEVYLQQWYSQTALADYLLGYGHHNHDGYGIIDPSNPSDIYAAETPRLGIRHPGPDGAWGAGLGDLTARMTGTNPNIDTGPVLGPYLEVATDRILGSTNGTTDAFGNLNVFLPGQGAYSDDDPKVLIDYWGRPLRYYRRVHPVGSLPANYKATQAGGWTPTLGDVILLRPFRIDYQAAVYSPVADASGDRTVTTLLRSAEFAIFSPGPDRAFNSEIASDAASGESNADNIVEVGP